MPVIWRDCRAFDHSRLRAELILDEVCRGVVRRTILPSVRKDLTNGLEARINCFMPTLLIHPLAVIVVVTLELSIDPVQHAHHGDEQVRQQLAYVRRSTSIWKTQWLAPSLADAEAPLAQ